MKKFIGSVIVMIIFSLMIHGLANAQLTTLSTSLATERFSTVAEAKATAKAVVSKAKAEKYFNKNFKTASKVTWTRDAESIHAYFKENEVDNRIAYNKNGKWFRTIRTYDASHLDKRVSGIVKRQFKGYDITCVNEVREGGMHCYFLNIVKDKNFKQVILHQGEITVYEQFTLQ